MSKGLSGAGEEEGRLWAHIWPAAGLSRQTAVVAAEYLCIGLVPETTDITLGPSLQGFTSNALA